MSALGALAAGASGGVSWAAWTKRPGPVFTGTHVASDPSVLRGRDGYRMYYTAMDARGWPARARVVIALARSRDGLSWENADTGHPVAGTVLEGREGSWEENLEAAYAVEFGGECLLYYGGYRHEGHPRKGFPASMGLARSRDGVRFARVSDRPILSPSKGWYDNDALYSPVVFPWNGGLGMIYVGHCYTDASGIPAPGVRILGATSPDGVRWTKRPEPVLGERRGIPWMTEGAAEPGLLAGPDGSWYLAFTGMQGERRVLGIARGASPFGPWEIRERPILEPGPRGFDRAGVLAPHMLLEGGRVRMWFLGADRGDKFAIGYAEAAWPLAGGAAPR